MYVAALFIERALADTENQEFRLRITSVALELAQATSLFCRALELGSCGYMELMPYPKAGDTTQATPA